MAESRYTRWYIREQLKFINYLKEASAEELASHQELIKKNALRFGLRNYCKNHGFFIETPPTVEEQAEESPKESTPASVHKLGSWLGKRLFGNAAKKHR